VSGVAFGAGCCVACGAVCGMWARVVSQSMDVWRYGTSVFCESGEWFLSNQQLP
jgi:hypothetical protein